MFDFLKKLVGPAEEADLSEVLKRDPMIIDVRSPFEYEQGHIQRSVNIPVNELKKKLGDIKRSGSPVIVVCRSGARSKMAAEFLQQAGVEVYNGGPWSAVAQRELLY